MLKYLRIAVTALSLTACVLLIALWVLSYRRFDYGFARLPRSLVAQLVVNEGQIVSEIRPWDSAYDDDSDPHWVTIKESPYLPSPPPPWLPRHSFVGFGWEFSARRAVSVHFYVPVILSFVIAAAPWISWYTRFSLLTLLIATMLVAVTLGTIIYLFG